MQVLKVIDNNKRPSKTLEKLIDNCVSDFSKLNKSVNRVLEQGRKEGFTDLETGKLIRQKLIVAGFSDRTARRYLPASAKHMEKSRYHGQSVDKLSTNIGSNLNSNSAVNLSTKPKSKSKAKSEPIQTPPTIEFMASITVNQRHRTIRVPAEFREEIDRHFVGAGKKVNVTIRL